MIQARIVDDFAFGGGVSVFIVEGQPRELARGETVVRQEGRRLMHVGPDGWPVWELFETGVAEPTSATFRLPDEMPRALRKDYEAERARVDKLISALIGRRLDGAAS